MDEGNSANRFEPEKESWIAWCFKHGLTIYQAIKLLRRYKAEGINPDLLIQTGLFVVPRIANKYGSEKSKRALKIVSNGYSIYKNPPAWLTENAISSIHTSITDRYWAELSQTGRDDWRSKEAFGALHVTGSFLSSYAAQYMRGNTAPYIEGAKRRLSRKFFSRTPNSQANKAPDSDKTNSITTPDNARVTQITSPSNLKTNTANQEQTLLDNDLDTDDSSRSLQGGKIKELLGQVDSCMLQKCKLENDAATKERNLASAIAKKEKYSQEITQLVRNAFKAGYKAVIDGKRVHCETKALSHYKTWLDNPSEKLAVSFSKHKPKSSREFSFNGNELVQINRHVQSAQAAANLADRAVENNNEVLLDTLQTLKALLPPNEFADISSRISSTSCNDSNASAATTPIEPSFNRTIVTSLPESGNNTSSSSSSVKIQVGVEIHAGANSPHPVNPRSYPPINSTPQADANQFSLWKHTESNPPQIKPHTPIPKNHYGSQFK